MYPTSHLAILQTSVRHYESLHPSKKNSRLFIPERERRKKVKQAT